MSKTSEMIYIVENFYPHTWKVLMSEFLPFMQTQIVLLALELKATQYTASLLLPLADIIQILTPDDSLSEIPTQMFKKLNEILPEQLRFMVPQLVTYFSIQAYFLNKENPHSV